MKRLCYLISGLIALLFLAFSSLPASAFELTSNVWRVTYASVPQFQVKLAGLRWPDWTTEPYQIGPNALIEEIAIKGNAGSANANGFTWKSGDFFSIDIGFYSSSDGCDQSFSGSFGWSSSATEVMQSRLIGSYNNADICYTQWNVITSTWSDGSGVIDLVPQEMFSNHGNAAVIVSAVSLWRYTSTGGGSGSFDDSGIIDAINKQTEQQKQIADSTEQIKDFVTNTDQPNAGDIANADSLPSVGLLPPGPVDSLLLLPFNILNSIVSSLGGACTPVTAPLPFVDQTIQFPCFGDTIYKGDFAPLINIIGTVASAVLLYGYFKHLYMRITVAACMGDPLTAHDEWGML